MKTPRRCCVTFLPLLWALFGQPAVADPWRFVATCDSRGASGSQQVNTAVLREIATAAVADAPDLILFAGDLVTGPATEATFREWTNAMAPFYEAGVRVYPVRGNHDIGTGWAEVIGHDLPTNGPAGEIGLTYSFTNRNALFLGMDNFSGSYQYWSAPISIDTEWIAGQLASNSLPHVFAFGHTPAFKVRHFDCLDDVPEQRNAFWRSLVAAGGRAYFCGHDHFYDHSRIDDGDGNPVNDAHQYVAGTAGAPFYEPQPYNGNNGPWQPVPVYFDREYGYILAEVDGPRATLTWKRRVAPNTFVAADVFTYNVNQGRPLTRYVSPSGLHEPPFTNWVSAATNIQAAVDAAGEWDTVLVTNGVYTGGVTVSRSIEVRSVNGPQVTEILGSGVTGSNAVRCATVTGRARLTGFTLRDGRTAASGSVNLVMSGGGAWCGDDSIVDQCVITGNEAAALGGGVYLSGAASLRNSIVHRNRAQHGGGVFCWQGGSVVHCSVCDNETTATLFGGGGIHCYAGGAVLDSIVYHNHGYTNVEWYIEDGGSITYSCTRPSPSATCITSDPMFTDASNANYRLEMASPCIDRAILVAGSQTDLVRYPRPLDGDADGTAVPDMGAFEFVHANADSDGDGLLDLDEIELLGTNPTLRDSDRDGMADPDEFKAGTNPNDATSLLRIADFRAVTNDAGVTVWWETVPARFYTVYAATNLRTGPWTDIGRVVGDGLMHAVTNTDAADARFYRIVVSDEAP